MRPSPAAQQPVQRLGRNSPVLVMARLDAGERRRDEFAQELVVVHAQHRDMLRNRKAAFLGSLDDLDGPIIPGGHDGRRLGELAQPVGQTGGFSDVELPDVEPVFRQLVGKAVRPVFGPLVRLVGGDEAE